MEMVTGRPTEQGFIVGLVAIVQGLSIAAKFWQNHDDRGPEPRSMQREERLNPSGDLKEWGSPKLPWG